MTNNINQTTQEQEIEHVKGIVARTLGSNYHNLRLADSGAMSFVFHANHGTPDGELRVIKADRIVKASPRAERYAQSGCGTARDSQTLASLPDARKHHIVRLLHYHPEVEGISISEMDHIDGETLEARVLKHPLEPGHAELVMANILDAANYYSSRGVLHRDINPKNILIENGTDEAYVIDFGNSGEKTSFAEKASPTGGRAASADPLLYERFTGEKRNYSEQNELHSIGEVGFYSLTGGYVYRHDPDTGVLRDFVGEGELKTVSGEVNLNAANQCLEDALARLPKNSRRLASSFRRALTLDENLRYGRETAIAEFTADYLKATGLKSVEKPRREGVLSRRSLLRAGALALGVATLLGGVGVAYHASRVNRLENQVVQAGKYDVVSEWDDNECIISNIVDLKPTILKKERFEVLYENRKPELVQLKQGEVVEVIPRLTDKPFPKEKRGLSKLHGVVYIEGFQRIPFESWPESFRPITNAEGYTGPPLIDFKVPNVPDGIYNLIVEAYAPLESDLDEWERKGDYLKDLKFKDPGKVLVRERIPIVIGNPQNRVRLERLSLEPFTPHISFRNGNDGRLNSQVDYEISIPGTDYRKLGTDEKGSSGTFSGNLFLPKANSLVNRVLQYQVRDTNGLVSFGCFPIKTNKISDNIFEWDYDIPGRDFPDKVREFYEGLRKK